MSGLNKGIRKVEMALKWDPSPTGQPPTDLDIVAATYLESDPHGAPAYVVHFDSRSPDGTIYLNRDSKDGKGFGWDEVMTLELDRLDARYARVVVGVVIQQNPEHRTFVGVLNPAFRIREGYTVLDEDDFMRRPRRDRGDGRGVPARVVRRMVVPLRRPGLRGRPGDVHEDHGPGAPLLKAPRAGPTPCGP